MPSNKVRTRFAPSPTGYMHVGNLRTALYTYLMAKHDDGTFILRIEDTDQKRQVEGGVSEIISSLRDFDIRFDEGPANETEDYGGYGPYRQSLRREIYQTYARDLVERDLAYPCFCSEEELQALREQQEQAGEPQKGYFGKWAVWRDQPDERVLEKLQAGEPHVIRLKCSMTSCAATSPCRRTSSTSLSSSATDCRRTTSPTSSTTTSCARPT